MNVFENARWIGTDPAWAAPVITRSFTAGKGKHAKLFITGLGYFHAEVNGRPVTDQYYLPVISDYEPRDLSAFIYPLHDTLTHRIYYYEFDIARLLQPGENTLTIQLAGGFYRQKDRTAEGPVDFGEVLKTVYRLELEGETILSDGSETQQESDIRRSSLFYGEVVDHTFIPGEGKPVTLLPDPEAELSPAIGTPDRIVDRIRPALLGKVGEKAIYDAGCGISGLVEVKTSAPAGSRITLRFADRIHEDLSLDFGSCGSDYISPAGEAQIQNDTFITGGGEETFLPRFVWHAFRYFEVEGPVDSVEICVIHSDTAVNAEFSSDFEGVNFLFNAYLASQLSNMHGSVPSDCPHRERLGYTGDGQLCAPAAMLMLDSREFYEKWIQDILDCQCKSSGHVQHTAPLMGGGGGPGGWGSAIITVPWAFWQRWGDKAMLEKCYAPMLRWIDYLKTRLENGLVTHEEKDGWCLGEWCTLKAVEIPEAFVNTCYLVKTLQMLENIAGILGKTEDIPALYALREETEQAIIRTWRDPESGHFAGGVQGADAWALWCGLGDGALADRLAEKYDAMGHFDTGFLGTDVLMEVLFDSGHGDTALRLLESREPGSFLYMMDNGASTLWENWTGESSWNHPMFGGCARHLFSGVLGIRQRPGTVGYTDLVIDPLLLPEGEFARGTLRLGKSTLTVELDCTENPPMATVTASLGMKVAVADETAYMTVVEIG